MRNVAKIITYQWTRGTQTFQQYKGHLKILDVKLVERNRLCAEYPEKLGANLKKKFSSPGYQIPGVCAPLP